MVSVSDKAAPMENTGPLSGLDLNLLLEEIRQLRIQLVRTIDNNNLLRQKLEDQLTRSPPRPNSRHGEDRSTGRKDHKDSFHHCLWAYNWNWKNLFSCDLDSIHQSNHKFAHHNSWTVMTFTNIWPDLIIIFQASAKCIFARFGLWAHNCLPYGSQNIAVP